MNNTKQKNIVLSFESGNTLPFTKSPNKLNQFSDIDMNTNFRQLVDNDLYEYQRVKSGSRYVSGVKVYDEQTIKTAPNGYKVYGRNIKDGDFAIYRKQNLPIGESLSSQFSSKANCVHEINGVVYVGTEKGLYTLNPEGNLVEEKEFDNTCDVKYIYTKRDNTQTFFCTNKGIFTRNANNKYNLVSDNSLSNVNCIYEHNDVFHVGTDIGMYVGKSIDQLVYKSHQYDKKINTINSITYSEDEIKQDINLLKEDLLIGTDEGIFKSKEERVISGYKEYPVLQGVDVICHLKINGGVILGTENGLYRYDGNDVEHIGLDDIYVNVIKKIDNYYYIGTNEGVFCTKNNFSTFDHLTSQNLSNSENDVNIDNQINCIEILEINNGGTKFILFVGSTKILIQDFNQSSYINGKKQDFVWREIQYQDNNDISIIDIEPATEKVIKKAIVNEQRIIVFMSDGTLYRADLDIVVRQSDELELKLIDYGDDDTIVKLIPCNNLVFVIKLKNSRYQLCLLNDCVIYDQIFGQNIVFDENIKNIIFDKYKDCYYIITESKTYRLKSSGVDENVQQGDDFLFVDNYMVYYRKNHNDMHFVSLTNDVEEVLQMSFKTEDTTIEKMFVYTVESNQYEQNQRLFVVGSDKNMYMLILGRYQQMDAVQNDIVKDLKVVDAIDVNYANCKYLITKTTSGLGTYKCNVIKNESGSISTFEKSVLKSASQHFYYNDYYELFNVYTDNKLSVYPMEGIANSEFEPLCSVYNTGLTIIDDLKFQNWNDVRNTTVAVGHKNNIYGLYLNRTEDVYSGYRSYVTISKTSNSKVLKYSDSNNMFTLVALWNGNKLSVGVFEELTEADIKTENLEFDVNMSYSGYNFIETLSGNQILDIAQLGGLPTNKFFCFSKSSTSSYITTFDLTFNENNKFVISNKSVINVNVKNIQNVCLNFGGDDNSVYGYDTTGNIYNLNTSTKLTSASSTITRFKCIDGILSYTTNDNTIHYYHNGTLSSNGFDSQIIDYVSFESNSKVKFLVLTKDNKLLLDNQEIQYQRRVYENNTFTELRLSKISINMTIDGSVNVMISDDNHRLIYNITIKDLKDGIGQNILSLVADDIGSGDNVFLRSNRDVNYSDLRQITRNIYLVPGDTFESNNIIRFCGKNNYDFSYKLMDLTRNQANEIKNIALIQNMIFILTNNGLSSFNVINHGTSPNIIAGENSYIDSVSLNKLFDNATITDIYADENNAELMLVANNNNNNNNNIYKVYKLNDQFDCLRAQNTPSRYTTIGNINSTSGYVKNWEIYRYISINASSQIKKLVLSNVPNGNFNSTQSNNNYLSFIDTKNKLWFLEPSDESILVYKKAYEYSLDETINGILEMFPYTSDIAYSDHKLYKIGSTLTEITDKLTLEQDEVINKCSTLDTIEYKYITVSTNKNIYLFKVEHGDFTLIDIVPDVSVDVIVGDQKNIITTYNGQLSQIRNKLYIDASLYPINKIQKDNIDILYIDTSTQLETIEYNEVENCIYKVYYTRNLKEIRSSNKFEVKPTLYNEIQNIHYADKIGSKENVILYNNEYFIYDSSTRQYEFLPISIKDTIINGVLIYNNKWLFLTNNGLITTNKIASIVDIVYHQYKTNKFKLGGVKCLFKLSDKEFLVCSDINGLWKLNTKNDSINQILSGGKCVGVQKMLNEGEVNYVTVCGDVIYLADDIRIWDKYLELDKELQNINSFYFMSMANFYLLTDNGLIQTTNKYELINDNPKFTELSANQMYEESLPILNDIFNQYLNGHIKNQHNNLNDEFSLVSYINNEYETYKFNDIRGFTITEQNDQDDLFAVGNDIVSRIETEESLSNTIEVYVDNFYTGELKKIEGVTFILKLYASGVTDLYINIPTTYTYYLNHIESLNNCDFDHTLLLQSERANLKQLPRDKRIQNSDIESHKTKFKVFINKNRLPFDMIYNIECNGMSLPLKIYKETNPNLYCGEDGLASRLFNSLILDTQCIGQYDEDDYIAIEFQNFGTDEQAIHIMGDIDVTQINENVYVTYTIEFDPGIGGLGTMSPCFCKVGTPILLPPCNFTNSNTTKQFIGWEYNGKVYKDCQIINEPLIKTNGAKITFTALWDTKFQFDENIDTIINIESNGSYFQIYNVGIMDNNTLKVDWNI